MHSLFDNIGFMSCGILNVSPKEAFDLCSRGAIIIDVREEYLNNFKSFDVPLVFCLPRSLIEQEYLNLPMDKYLIFADTVGLRSKEAVLFIKEAGYSKIANMAGGIVDWEKDGLPLRTNIDERFTGSCMCQLRPREGKRSKK